MTSATSIGSQILAEDTTHVLCGNINFRFSTSNLSSGSLLQFFTLISNMGVAPRSTYPFGRADTTPPSPSTHFRQQNRANSSSKCSCDHLVLRSQNVLQNHLQKSLPPPTRVRSPVEAVFTFSCFTANLQIFTLFYFGVVYFTIEFERKKKNRVVTMVKSFQISSIKKSSLFLNCNVHVVRH